MKICLVHDLAESVVGDITPLDPVTKEEKRILEEVSWMILQHFVSQSTTNCILFCLQNALRKIANDVGNKEIADELITLWLEYEEGSSSEAEVAKQLDKFEMIVQANEYEIANPEKRLESFFKSTEGYFSHPEVSSWDVALRSQRDQRWQEKQQAAKDL